MGGGNPLRQIVTAATDVVLSPIRETARAVGLDGVVQAAEGVKDFAGNTTQQISDLATGEGAKREKEYEGRVAAEQGAAAETAQTETRRQVAAVNSEAETARMAAGSRSRTLLTGPKGLEDDTKVPTARRTLSAR